MSYGDPIATMSTYADTILCVKHAARIYPLAKKENITGSKFFAFLRDTNFGDFFPSPFEENFCQQVENSLWKDPENLEGENLVLLHEGVPGEQDFLEESYCAKCLKKFKEDVFYFRSKREDFILYKGTISVEYYGHNFNTLLLRESDKSSEPLADMIADDILEYGSSVSISYALSQNDQKIFPKKVFKKKGIGEAFLFLFTLLFLIIQPTLKNLLLIITIYYKN